MKTVPMGVMALVCAAGLVGACDTAPRTEGERATLGSDVQSSLMMFKNADPSLSELLNKSVGIAVFPDVGKAGFIAGGAYGRGEVWDNMRGRIGFADVSKGSIGLQAGAQTFAELVVFMRAEEFERFQRNSFEFGADVSAVAIKSGSARTADFSKGVIVFTMVKGGLMAEASIGGQRFTFQPM